MDWKNSRVTDAREIAGRVRPLHIWGRRPCFGSGRRAFFMQNWEPDAHSCLKEAGNWFVWTLLSCRFGATNSNMLVTLRLVQIQAAYGLRASWTLKQSFPNMIILSSHLTNWNSSVSRDKGSKCVLAGSSHLSPHEHVWHSTGGYVSFPLWVLPLLRWRVCCFP